MASRKSRKPSRDQVRAWLSTVVAPLIQALEVERDRCRSRSWSFRQNRQDFEFLWSTEGMVAPVYRPNLKQFLRYHPAIRRLSLEHDRHLEQLRSSACEAFKSLVDSTAFKSLVPRIPGVEPKCLAEYVVDGLRDLPPEYDGHKEWSAHGNDFLALRRRPELRQRFDALERSGSDFGSRVDALLEALDDVQEEYADRFGLPAVEPSVNWTA